MVVLCTSSCTAAVVRREGRVVMDRSARRNWIAGRGRRIPLRWTVSEITAEQDGGSDSRTAYAAESTDLVRNGVLFPAHPPHDLPSPLPRSCAAVLVATLYSAPSMKPGFCRDTAAGHQRRSQLCRRCEGEGEG